MSSYVTFNSIRATSIAGTTRICDDMNRLTTHFSMHHHTIYFKLYTITYVYIYIYIYMHVCVRILYAISYAISTTTVVCYKGCASPARATRGC